ncbi:MAG: hypothetical protein R6W68_13015 [Ignavibacteriaceae bacterium]
MKYFKILVSGLLIFIIYSCSSLVLKPADFSWPIESVLKIDADGNASEDRYTFSFNIKPLFYEELEDSLAYLDRQVRIIRNFEGYYFITSPGFKNVYVFESSEGELEMESKILIDESGLEKPVFNQRSPFIELIDGTKKYYLTKSEIERGEK